MKIFIGIDPGEIAGYAELRIFDTQSKPVEIVSREFTSGNDPSIISVCYAIDGVLATDGWDLIYVSVEDIRFQNRKVGESTFKTSKHIGYLHGRLYGVGIAVREYSFTEHLRVTVAGEITHIGNRSAIERELRIALELKYGKDILKKAGCTTTHKRMALSIATARAMQEGAISW